MVDVNAEDLSFCNCSISLSSTFEADNLVFPHGSLFLLVCDRLRGEEGTAESNRDVRSDGERASRVLSLSKFG